MGIVVGGVVGLFGAMLFGLATYKSCVPRQEWRQQHYRPPGQTNVMNGWSLAAQVVGALAAVAGLIVAIYFGVKPKRS